MSVSTYAFILAVVELLVGLPLVVAPAKTADWLTRLIEKDVQYRLVGAVFLVISVLVLAENSSVNWSVAGLVRLAAWLGAIKSLIICWWPGWHAELADWFLATTLRRRAFGVAAVAAGVLFFWAGSVL